MIKYVLSAKDSDNIIFLRASGSVVEYRLAKARVAGSNPVSRFYFLPVDRSLVVSRFFSCKYHIIIRRAHTIMYKYEIIAQDIQSKILSGFYKPDEKLPQEHELCKQYDASRITIREAMEHLVHNGLITKRRGSGTFVKAISGGSVNHEGFARSQQFGGFAKDHPGHHITSVIHEFQPLKASAPVAEQLQIPEGSFVCYICRTRKVDGIPYTTEYTYMPADIITGITDKVLEGSIYSYIENVLKLKVQSAHRIARASMPTDQERVWLEIGDAPLPVLEVEQVAYLGDGRIFEYSKSRHRADCFELRTVSIQ